MFFNGTFRIGIELEFNQNFSFCLVYAMLSGMNCSFISQRSSIP